MLAPLRHLIALVFLLAVPAAAKEPGFAVGPQYGSTHVYVPAEDFDRFVQSFAATFGGSPGAASEVQVTPAPSRTRSQLVQTPAGMASVFGYETPIPYPFGAERTGYLVTDMDEAVKSALVHGAVRLVDTFPDAIGRDVVLLWPGGVAMQLYVHTTPPDYPPLATIPESRVHLTPEAAEIFLESWLSFSHGRIVSDDPKAPGAEIGRPDETIRRVRITTGYGDMAVLVSDGKLPWPYGREITGYAVEDLDATLARARDSGVEVLAGPYDAGDRRAAMVRFPGGWVAEAHEEK